MTKIFEPLHVAIEKENVCIQGDLTLPHNSKGIVLFAHGSGSSRFSSRNQYIANVLNQNGFATLLIDLLTAEEECADRRTSAYRFDIPLLSRRLIQATDWLISHRLTSKFKIGYFGASTGAAAALMAAPFYPNQVKAIVSRGGRPDMAGDALPGVYTPTLFIVGGDDALVLELNESAFAQMPAMEKRLEIIPGATHLFEEPGTLKQVADLASGWFLKYLTEQKASKKGRQKYAA